jgi:hypothetical protein
MTKSAATALSTRKNEIVIAVIGLLGVLGTAVFSNWDKLHPPANQVKATFTGYAPTGDPQVELRYFFEVTGMRGLMQGMQTEMLAHFKQQVDDQYKDRPELAAELMKVMSEEIEAQYDQVLNAYIPIASKHFSVAEIQELNKFYSTPPMREMTRRAPLLTKEFMPSVMTLAKKSQERVEPKVRAVLEKYRQ